MSAGLFGLLDDIAALARLAAASVDDVGAAAGRASAKAAGVVVDDTAVTPQYVQNVAAKRELPIIRKIARGSLRNKLLFILPAALLLSEFLPGLLTPLLMCGGTYLCYEGAEKVWERIHGHEEHAPVATETGDIGAEDEAHGRRRDPHRLHPVRRDHGHRPQRGGRRVVRARGRSSSRSSRSASPRSSTAWSALIVKMDDVGLRAEPAQVPALAQRVGIGMVRAMPTLLDVISTVGVAAMLWVGGHILLVGRRRPRVALALRRRPPLGGGRRPRPRRGRRGRRAGWSTPPPRPSWGCWSERWPSS